MRSLNQQTRNQTNRRVGHHAIPARASTSAPLGASRSHTHTPANKKLLRSRPMLELPADCASCMRGAASWGEKRQNTRIQGQPHTSRNIRRSNRRRTATEHGRHSHHVAHPDSQTLVGNSARQRASSPHAGSRRYGAAQAVAAGHEVSLPRQAGPGRPQTLPLRWGVSACSCEDTHMPPGRPGGHRALQQEMLRSATGLPVSLVYTSSRRASAHASCRMLQLRQNVIIAN